MPFINSYNCNLQITDLFFLIFFYSKPAIVSTIINPYIFYFVDQYNMQVFLNASCWFLHS